MFGETPTGKKEQVKCPCCTDTSWQDPETTLWSKAGKKFCCPHCEALLCFTEESEKLRALSIYSLLGVAGVTIGVVVLGNGFWASVLGCVGSVFLVLLLIYQGTVPRVEVVHS